MLILEITVFWPRLPKVMRENVPIPALWKRLLASVYGGIDEEILLLDAKAEVICHFHITACTGSRNMGVAKGAAEAPCPIPVSTNSDAFASRR